MARQYWLLFHESLSNQGLQGFQKAVHGSILEMNMDYETNLWPFNPHTQEPGTHELCEVCQRFLYPCAPHGTKTFKAGCLSAPVHSLPCGFQPSHEAEQHQNLEDLLIDGSPLEYDMSYRSISDFFDAHDISMKNFIAIPLGVHDCIRSCRDWIRTASLI